jgi:hypothetical protein
MDLCVIYYGQILMVRHDPFSQILISLPPSPLLLILAHRNNRLGTLSARCRLPLWQRDYQSLRTCQRNRSNSARAPAGHGGVQIDV